MPGNEDREKLDLDFGIEDTVDAGDPALLASFLGGSTEGITLKTDKDKEGSSTTDKSTTKPAPKKEEKKEDIDLGKTVLGDEDKDDDNQDAGDEGKQVDDTNKEGGDAESIMASLAKEFVGMGLFRGGEGEEVKVDPNMTPEQFLEMYNDNKTRDINETISSFLSRFGEDYAEMFDAVFVKGVDPRSYLQSFTKLQDIGSLDMTQEASQEKVYAEYLRRQGFSEDKIEARVKKAKVNGDLEEDSTEFQKILIDQDAKELESQKQVKEAKQLEDKRSKQVFAQAANKLLVEKVKDKEYDGLPLTEQIAKTVFDYVTNEKWKLKTGETITDFDKFILELRKPENAATKIKLALLALNNFDLSKVKIKEKNDAAAKAFQWATKGKEIGGKNSAQTKGTQVKETEPFI